MEIYETRDSCRSNFNKYLMRAFKHIPKIENANVLDLGCGTGVSICEIAKTLVSLNPFAIPITILFLITQSKITIYQTMKLVFHLATVFITYS